MWWNRPILAGLRRVLPENIIDVVARSYAVVEVGGLSGTGPERGRRFEKLFYDLCERRGIHLSEKAGSITLANQRSASGLRHEVDGGIRSVDCITHWELKHLSSRLEKNELLVFNNKSLDYLQGSTSFYAKIPLHRFLLSGHSIGEDCRCFASLWGITSIEPERFPLPLIYDAVARGAASSLTPVECSAVRDLAIWACRPLQQVVNELSIWCTRTEPSLRCGPALMEAARAANDLQEQIGSIVLDYLDEHFPDWVNDIAEETWQEVGGW